MLTDQTLARLDAMALHMRDFARGGAGGLRKSKALGSSVEFSDFREYAPGDDMRRVDWNAFARFDRLFMKLFMEEQETCLTILLDASASMRDKWAFAVQLAEAMCYLALRGGDRVVIAALSDGGIRECPPLSGRASFLRASAFIAGIQPGGKTQLSAGVERYRPKARKGMCVLISDLFSEDGSERALASLQYKGQQVALLHLLSPDELRPQLDGAVRLIDSETGAAIDLMANQQALREYHEALDGFIAGAKALCHSRSADYVLLRSDMELMEALGGALARAGVITT